MKMITLNELRLRFHPNLTKYKFAEEMGLNNSLCSKILSGKYDCSLGSKKWLELCEHVRNKYNLQLVSENKFAIEGEKATRIINNLKRENKELREIKSQYEQVIEDLLKCIKIKNTVEEITKKANQRLSIYKEMK